MSRGKGLLAPLVRSLPDVSPRPKSPWMPVRLDDDLWLIPSIRAIEREEWARLAAGLAQLPNLVTSRSSVGEHRVVLIADERPVGVDIERLDRIGRNATPRDDWLAREEQALVDRAMDPELELACHWVLKEAYGKALGVGLNLPLDALAFVGRARAIALEGAAAPPRHEAWRFGLYRRHDFVIAVAYR